ncbi:MAG: hypothetical protein QG673_23 [Pseudomonadota bacterium]|nr:hypothetical protein [Pseudomonadota bacterium]
MRSVYKIATIMFSTILTTAYSQTVYDNGTNILWTAVFENSVPQSSKVSQAFCDTHTPSIISTTIQTITSESGTTASNGVNIRYISYDSKTVNGLHFNVVHGELSGQDSSNKPWKHQIKLYEQTLEEVGKTYTVWSTPYCKGIFTGYPTVLPTSTTLQHK